MTDDNDMDTTKWNEVERAWIEEAERRLEEYRAGLTEAKSAEKIFESLRSRKKQSTQ